MSFIQKQKIFTIPFISITPYIITAKAHTNPLWRILQISQYPSKYIVFLAYCSIHDLHEICKL